MSVQNELKTFGLEDKKASVYLALLELGQAKAQEISKKAGVLRPTAYGLLEQLTAEGLVGTYEKHGVRYYIASDPEKIKRNLIEKQQAFDLLLPSLSSLYNAHVSKPKILFFEGIEGVKTVLEDTLKGSEPNLRGILSMTDLYKIPGKRFMDEYVANRIAKGFSLRVIRSKPKEVEETWATSNEEHRLLRYAPTDYVFDMTTYLYGHKVGLISSKKENFGMIIESEEFSKTMGYMFEALWQTSEPSSPV